MGHRRNSCRRRYCARGNRCYPDELQVSVETRKKTETKQEVVRRGEFLVRVRESGNLRSFIEVDVRSNVEGEIVKILVDEAQKVEMGQPLLRIDEKQILEQKKQAQANLDARKAELERAQLRIHDY